MPLKNSTETASLLVIKTVPDRVWDVCYKNHMEWQVVPGILGKTLRVTVLPENVCYTLKVLLVSGGSDKVFRSGKMRIRMAIRKFCAELVV